MTIPWQLRDPTAIISLIPTLSHRLSYLTFRTISRSCVGTPTITWLPCVYAYVYIMHMNPMCVAQSAARGTVKSELGQWIRITIRCAQLKRNLELISVFHCHLRAHISWLRTLAAYQVRKAKNRLLMKIWTTRIIAILLVFLNKMSFFRIFDEWYKTTNEWDRMKW